MFSQKTLQSDDGELVVYTVAAGGALYQELLFGYCYKVDRRLAVEENGAVRLTDAPNLGWDLDILDPDLLLEPSLEPFAYTMDAAKVLAASAAGIISGVGDGKFDPTATTNREQIATMVARAIDYLNRQTGTDLAPAAADISQFSDQDQVSSWAVDGVGTLASNGIMNGTTTTRCPQRPPAPWNRASSCFPACTSSSRGLSTD